MASSFLYSVALQGQTVEIINANDVVDLKFEEEGKRQLHRLKRVRGLWIKADYTTNHKWLEPVMGDLVSSRQHPTIITAFDSLPVRGVDAYRMMV